MPELKGFFAKKRAQTATEYLLLIGGAVAVLVIITILALNTIGTGEDLTNCNFDAGKSSLVVPPDGIRITSPTLCKKAIMTGVGGSGSGSGYSSSFVVKFDVGSKVKRYGVIVSSQKSAGYSFCADQNPGGYSYPANVAQPNGSTVSYVCNVPGDAPCGAYDVAAYAFDSQNKTMEISMEKGAVEVKNSDCPGTSAPVVPVTPFTCPAGAHVDSYGTTCECDNPNFVFLSGTCVAKVTCTSPSFWVPPNSCGCGFGYNYYGGTCMPIPACGSSPNTCTNGGYVFDSYTSAGVQWWACSGAGTAIWGCHYP
ncbi:MAG TPA: hypothetical protein VJH23_03615 [archaeon]|nr:hypothetical protein [archaeon]